MGGKLMAETKGVHFRLPAETLADLDYLVERLRAEGDPAWLVSRTTALKIAVREMAERKRKNPVKKSG